MQGPIRAVLWLTAVMLTAMPFSRAAAFDDTLLKHFKALTQSEDRSTGTPGCDAAADYIADTFERLGLKSVGRQAFFLPVPVLDEGRITVNAEHYPLFPWAPNMALLSQTPPEGLEGPLVDVYDGALTRFDGRTIENALVLMDVSSEDNWWLAAQMGAKAVIFLGQENDTRDQFLIKNIPTPLDFPRFYAPLQVGAALRRAASQGARAHVLVRSHWEHRLGYNIYGLVPGSSPPLSKELVIIEAPYDAASHVVGLAPGADQAVSAAVLLRLAEYLASHPPARSVMLAAVSGHGQGLLGTRHFLWTLDGPRRSLRLEQKSLHSRQSQILDLHRLLTRPDPLKPEPDSPNSQNLVWSYVVERAKDEADRLSREAQGNSAILAQALQVRRLSWKEAHEALSPEERLLAMDLVQKGLKDLQDEGEEVAARVKVVKSWMTLRNVAEEYERVLHLGLSLSSQSDLLTLSEWGGTFPLREQVYRMVRNVSLAEIFRRAAEDLARMMQEPSIFAETGRHASESTARAVEIQGPMCLACDIGALSSCPSFAVTSANNRRTFWDTPNDTTAHINHQGLLRLQKSFPELLARVLAHPKLRESCRAGLEGLASVEGKALFIRQGELFADKPAPGTVVCALQGNSLIRVMTFRDGSFFIPAVANKRVAFQKLILESYGIDAKTGKIQWATDKVQTSKDNYRLNIKGRIASTTLVMFHCRQTDVLGIFNPQRMEYLTKITVLDGVAEARPLRYWYSRVDGRDTFAVSLFLEPGSRFKLILSDTLLRKELLLLNATSANPKGSGYPVGQPRLITKTAAHVADDLIHLVGERLKNLSTHGISNRYLENLYWEAVQEREQAREDEASLRHSRAWEGTVSAWAKLNTVYNEIENTQRDVLGGVMFFIALFVPFAYCLERYLFCFRNIYKQITAFFVLLIATILTIRALHPAFRLTYNPMVVILAFFIVALSVTVSWILFVRFEREMAASSAQKESAAPKDSVNKWQAFGAGFAIGASNLNRRRLRTALTSITLIILTFTIMSFTNVKSLTKTTMTPVGQTPTYTGVLVRHQFWRPLTPISLESLVARYGDRAIVWPRSWMDPPHPSLRAAASIQVGEMNIPAEGVLGVGPHAPQPVKNIVHVGRWFRGDDAQVVLLSTHLAEKLGLDPARDVGKSVKLWELPFTVIGFFDADRLEALTDLDGSTIKPVYLEIAPDEDLSEQEAEAMESGDIVTPLVERFRSASAETTVLVPHSTCLSLGGTLRAVSLITPGASKAVEIAEDLSRRLAFPLFVGSDVTYYHSASKTLRYQGVANLLVPMLIVVFICLNTMIGHVHERKSEIGVYTSVGLAPNHVGFLFIVEALSLAVLSTVIGYIVAQLTAHFLGTTHLFAELTFNYSSLASVACMVLVFSVVLLASLYPARLAAALAMPDVTRTWTVPKAQGDLLELRLPFLLKPEEEAGIMAFLSRFIGDHQDVAQGPFIVDDVNLTLQSPSADGRQLPEPGCLWLYANVWLAPFDFGVKQRLHLHCCPSADDPGYMEVALQMIRLSGERTTWQRANRNFIKVMRKQMLLWRLLDADTKAQYGASVTSAGTHGFQGNLEASFSGRGSNQG
ncbi:FtsX-like permease family protein [Desulfosoma sp.]|uniref:FtsX-like permease family protein n=1 Tax=Desulfosoma sp. TaxID=2603217 RepID=UPI00404A823E